MSIPYYKRQNTDKKSLNHGKWYGRAYSFGTISTEQLSQKISSMCTVNEADVEATLRALNVEMKTLLENSQAVRLPGIGLFRPALRGGGGFDSEDKCNASRAVAKVNFLPERTAIRTLQDGKPKRKFLTKMLVGVKSKYVERYKKNTTTDTNTTNENHD